MKKSLYRFVAILMLSVYCVTAAHAQVDITPTEGLKDINGTKLFCKVIGQGEPLIIIHGGPTMNHEYFLPHFWPLVNNYKLIFYDQRSAGRSAIDSNNMSWSTMVEDIDGIRQAFGLDSVNILAHSWGTKLALIYTLEHPERVKKLILSNPIVMSHEFDSVQTELMNKKISPEDRQEFKSLTRSEAFARGDLGVVKQLLTLNYKSAFYDTANMKYFAMSLPDNFMQSSMVTMKGLNTDQRNYDKNYYPLMPELKMPVLIIHGMADNIVLEADQKMQQSLGNAQLVLFSKSGHFPFIEENDKYIKTITGFLSTADKDKKKKK
jgi:proline iminopeptidase